MLSYMPNEIIRKILTYLKQREDINSAIVSKRIASIILSPNICVNYKDLDIYSYFENITVLLGNIKLIHIVNDKKYISEVFEKAREIFENNEVEIMNPSTTNKSDIIRKTYSITLKESSKIKLTELINLKKLIIYDKKFLESIPDNITDLAIFVNDRTNDIKYPSNLKILRIINARENDLINLENKLQSLYLYGKSSCNIEHLGNSLEKLAIYGEYRSKINKFPNKLKYLSFGSEICYVHQLPELPENLEVLKLPSKENENILNPNYKFPPQLKKLIFGKDYVGKLDDLPDTLECISLSKNTTQEIVKFPKNLKEITFNEYPKNNITTIPDSVLVIRVINECTNPIKYLPPNLERLETRSSAILMVRLPKNCKWYKF